MSIIRNRARLFEEMGIGPEWRLRGEPASSEETVIAVPDAPPVIPQAFSAPPSDTASRNISQPVVSPSSGDISRSRQDFSGWEELIETIRNCTNCGLCQTRTNTVPGVGDIHADWLFIGEGPGYHEDQQGEPFVGRSGMLLDNMLATLGIKRGNNAYIANIVKCRASDERKKDRQPTEEEAALCMPYLQWQMEKINPKIIVALGKTAAAGLLNTDRSISMAAMRGKVHWLPVGDADIPLVVTYHPAYLLRTPMAKKQAWTDLCLAMDILEKL